MSLSVDRRGEVMLVGLDRPDKRNALDITTVGELGHVLDEARQGDPAILVIHSTTPGMFVSGADIGELLDRGADEALQSINAGLFEKLENYRWPTIAAVDGPALGGGCELALACDFRLASKRAVFAQPELNLGIIAGAGANWRLAQIVGLPMARRMLYTGAVLSAEAALSSGLIEDVFPSEGLLDATIEYAQAIAKQSWRALELTKLALRQHRPATTVFDVTAQALLFESEEKRVRMNAFLNDRRGSRRTQ